VVRCEKREFWEPRLASSSYAVGLLFYKREKGLDDVGMRGS
jgi:hypothetical protein